MKIICAREPTPELVRFHALARCLGIDGEFIPVETGDSVSRRVEDAVLGEANGIVFDVDALKDVCSQEETLRVASAIREANSSVLLIVTKSSEAADRFLDVFSAGVVKNTRVICNADTILFPPGNLTPALATHTFPRGTGQALALELRVETNADVVMKTGNAPSFVRMRIGGAAVFVWSTAQIMDVSEKVASEKQFEDALDQYAPAIIFLRYAFTDYCWHNPRLAATVVIDDPLLREQYGFLNFPTLLESARQYGYHITLAFIPWNYWRSGPAASRVFLDYADCFSVCAHGCDHTNKEFASKDYELLLAKTFVVGDRMKRLRKRTGLAGEPLMVCPQEVYSIEAMRAFADSRQFVGVANTACLVRNFSGQQICAGDLLLPAQDAYFGIPVFKRHYPVETAGLARSMFIGKPIVLAEHHEFFRNGPARMERLVLGLAEHGVDWMSAYKVAITTHMQRCVAPGRRELRFFTDTFEFDHSLGEVTRYRMLRRVGVGTRVEGVIVNGSPVSFVLDADFLSFDVCVDRPRKVACQLIVGAVAPKRMNLSSGRYQASVALRRGLSEFRDNFLARNALSLEAAKYLVKSLEAVRRRH